jgi:alpha-tubulin suppressor-like RCC1 family protein
MKNAHLLLFLFLLPWSLTAAPIPYSGKVAINGANFQGDARFTFALRDANGTVHWRNGADANSSVVLNVDRGLYICLLGGNAMNDFPKNLFLENSELFLQVRFYRADTKKWLHMLPDQRITSAPHALAAEVANLANLAKGVQLGAITKSMLAADVLADLNASTGVARLDPALKAHLAPFLKPLFSGPMGDVIARPGQSIVLNAPPASGAYFSYQWKKDGSPIAGATGSQLTVSADADHQYSVVAANAFGSSESALNALVARGGVNTIAAWEHTLYVDANGSLWTAGTNSYGRLGDGTNVHRSSPLKVVNGNVAAVAAGTGRSLFVKTDGSLWAMGSNSYGRLGDGTTTNRKTPVKVVDAGVTDVATGWEWSSFLKADGSLWAMGRNLFGQLGDGTTENRNTPAQVVDANVIAIASGNDHGLFLKADGTFWAVGRNHKGQLGDGTTTNRNAPVRIVDSNHYGLVGHWTFDEGAGANAANSASTGSLYDANLVGDSTFTSAESKFGGGSLHLPTGSSNARAEIKNGGISLNASYTVSAWFKNLYPNDRYRTLTRGKNFDHHVILRAGNDNLGLYVNGRGDFRDSGFDMPAGNYQGTWHHIAAAAEAGSTKFYVDGVFRGTGDRVAAGGIFYIGNYFDQPFAEYIDDVRVYGSALSGSQVAELHSTGNVNLTDLPDPGFRAVSAGAFHSFFVKSDGSLWAMGGNWDGQLGDGTTTDRHSPVKVMDANVTSVAAGKAHSLFLKVDGTLWATGWNGWGQLGDGTTADRNSPVQVASNVVRIAAGGAHSLYEKADGTLWATGRNNIGALGDGSPIRQTSPFEAVNANVTKVSAGNWHSLFLKDNGSLWAMGYNNASQLGDGTTDRRASPVSIVDANVTAIEAGGWHSLFLKNDGSLWAMGGNGDGRLGDGTTATRTTPVKVVDANVTAIEAGGWHSLFLKNDGSLWAMGSNGFGRLGDGTTTNRHTPVQIVDANVTAIEAGMGHSLFLKNNGSLWAMGRNAQGPLGDGTIANRHTPVQIVAANVTAINGRYFHSVFLKTDGSLWGMGYNFNGQLGDGTTTDRHSPVQIVASGVAKVSTGGGHTVFVKTDGSLWGMGRNAYGQLGDGTTTDRHSPVQVLSSGVADVSAGDSHTLIRMADGSLRSMGYDVDGALGTGRALFRSSYVQVASGLATD